MLLAWDRLANAGNPIAVIALSLGYESEKRVQHRLQKGYGLFATAIEPWPESDSPFRSFAWRADSAIRTEIHEPAVSGRGSS
jgi:hypothetical protein